MAGLTAPPATGGGLLVDATALDSDHRTRGIGRYVRGLISGFEKLDDARPNYLRLGGPLQRLARRHRASEAIAGDDEGVDEGRTLRLNRPPGPHLTRWLLNEALLPGELSGSCELFHSTEPASICAGPDFKSVVTVHDVIPLMFPDVYMQFPYLFWPLYYPRLERERRFERVDRVIAISRATRRELRERLGVPPEKITVVHNGIDHEQFQPVDNPADVRGFEREMGLGGRFVLYLGGDDFRKNIDVLVRALPYFPDDVELVLAGGMSSETKEKLGALAADLRVEHRLVFPGYIDDAHLDDLYASAEVFAYPSLAEGFGLQLLEAMAVGCPVAASDASSLSEVVGEAGLLFDPEDPEDVGKTLRRCLRDEQLQQELRAKGLERAAEFSWKRCAQETLAVYEDVLR